MCLFNGRKIAAINVPVLALGAQIKLHSNEIAFAGSLRGNLKCSRRCVFSSINNPPQILIYSNHAVRAGDYFYRIQRVCTHILAHMRIRDARRTNEGANKQAVEIDAALSPAKRHATSLMHMTHVGREKG